MQNIGVLASNVNNLNQLGGAVNAQPQQFTHTRTFFGVSNKNKNEDSTKIGFKESTNGTTDTTSHNNTWNNMFQFDLNYNPGASQPNQ